MKSSRSTPSLETFWNLKEDDAFQKLPLGKMVYQVQKASTRSVAIVISGKSVNKFVSNICFGSKGRNGKKPAPTSAICSVWQERQKPVLVEPQ